MMICTSDCAKTCRYGLEYGAERDPRVLCKIKEKSYWYGQNLDCDFFTKKDNEDERADNSNT